MSIDALLELLQRGAETEARELVSAAERQAEAIHARAEAEAQRRRAEARERLEQQGRQVVACEIAAWTRRQRGVLLAERARVLEGILVAAEAALGQAGPARYQRMLPALFRETLQFLEGVPAVVTCRPEIEAQLESLAADYPRVSIRPSADAAPGILAEAVDGTVSVDNTLPALLRRRRAELAVALAARLERGES